MSRNKRVSLLVGVVFSLVFLYAAFRNVDLGGVYRSFDRVNYYLIPVGIGFTLSSLLVRGLRLKLLTDRGESIPVLTLFQYNTFGWALNYVLPARSGEIAKALTCAAEQKVSKSFMLGAVSSTRLLDVIVFVTFLVSGAYYFEFAIPGIIVKLAAALLTVGFAGLLAVTVVENRLGRFHFIQNHTPHWMLGAVKRLNHALQALRSPRTAVFSIVLTFVLLSFNALAYYTYLVAFGLEVPLSAAPVLLGITGLGLVVPSSAGGIGPFQYFTILGLSLFGIPRGPALSFSLFYHGAQYLTAVLLGGPLIFKYRSLALDIWRGETEDQVEAVVS